MRPLPILVLLALGCRSEPARPAPSQPAATRPLATATPATTPPAPPPDPAGNQPAPDPWNVAPAARPDDPPSLGERRALADAACPTVEAPYFFRIEKAGKVSHILGTRHLGVSLAKFPRPVHDALASAKLAVFELAPGDHSDLPEQKIVLRDALGPTLWKHYQELVGKTTAQALESTTPSLALLTLTVLYEDISASLDLEIQRKVQAAQIPTRGLETSEFQDRLLSKILDLRMLRAAVSRTKDRAELAKESRDDLAEYCAGTDDTPGMDADMREDLLASGYTEAELAKIDEEMVFARNAAWIPELEELLATDGVFIAVGADHLTGPKGVVALLAARGYKLTRITK
jgi:uncharacterized protein YbaP (TraB family)